MTFIEFYNTWNSLILNRASGKAGMTSCIASNENLFIDADDNIYKEKQVINKKQQEKRVQQ